MKFPISLIAPKPLLAAPLLAAPLLLAACGSEPEPAAEAPLEGAWTLDPGTSRVNFVSVKAGEVAEAHYFDGVSGQVGADGAAEVAIDLASVETLIDIRNERMREMLFDLANFPEATITTQLDPATVTGLATGESTQISADTTVSLNGSEQTLPAQFTVTRIAGDKVHVETTAPLIVSASNFGLGEGIEALREVAGLDSITGQVPVSASLTFSRE